MLMHAVYFLMSSLLAMRTAACTAFAVADACTRTTCSRSALVSSCYFTTSSHRSNHHESSVRNRYARFRRRRSRVQLGLPEHHDIDTFSSQLIAKDCMKLLSRKGKTWERLGGIVDLAISSSNAASRSRAKPTIADIGTDHGLLAIALAATGRYEKVLGVDVSSEALENGARSFHRKVQEALSKEKDSEDVETNELPVEFRFGDGLSVLDRGEAQAIAIAGMGVNTMSKILNEKDLDRVGTTTLFLQPTNTKPANMIKLYDFLQASGWKPQQELLKYISRRWYFSIAFERNDDACPSPSPELFDSLPGDILRQDGSVHHEFKLYVDHHRQWLERDLSSKGSLSKDESRWLNAYGSSS